MPLGQREGVRQSRGSTIGGLRVPNGRLDFFDDLNLGAQQFQAGRDFGDFVVWRRDDVPAYQPAVVVDDAAMLVTEAVRGADLLKSTARQILLANALSLQFRLTTTVSW